MCEIRGWANTPRTHLPHHPLTHILTPLHTPLPHKVVSEALLARPHALDDSRDDALRVCVCEGVRVRVCVKGVCEGVCEGCVRCCVCEGVYIFNDEGVYVFHR